jgi:hypothetical protein
VQKIRQDFSHGLTSNILSAGAKAVGLPGMALPELSSTEKYADVGLAGNLATGGLTLVADPGATALLGAAGKGVSKIPGVSRIFDSAAEMAATRAAAAYAYKAVGDVAESALASANRNYVLNRLAREALKGAGEFGALEGATSLAKQANDQTFDPMQTVEDTLHGMGFGAIFGGGLGLIKRERVDFFKAARGPVAQGQMIEAAARKQSPIIEKELDTQVKQLTEQRDALKKSVDTKFDALRSDEKAALQERLAKTDQKLSDLQVQREALKAPEAVPQEDPRLQRSLEDKKAISGTDYDRSSAALDRAAEKAAKADSILTELTAAREGIASQLKNVSEYGSATQISKLTQQAAKLDAKIGDIHGQLQIASETAKEHLDRIETGHRALTEGERRSIPGALTESRAAHSSGQEKSWIDYHVSLERVNRDIEAAMQERALLQRGVDSPYVGVKGNTINSAQEHLAQLDYHIENAVQAKQDISNRFQQFVQDAGPLSLKQKLASGWQTRPEFLDASFKFANSEVDKLVERGVLDEHQKSAFVIQMTQDLLSKKGVLPSSKSALPASKTVRGFVQKIELMNMADRKKGTALVDATYDVIQAATKLDHWKVSESAQGHTLINTLVSKGLKPEEVTHLLTYVESTPEGLAYFNPEAVQSKALTRTAYAGPVPADKVLLVYPELGGLRQEFERIYSLATENGRKDIGYAPGYVKLMPKRGSIANVESASSATAESALSPSSYKERFGGQLDPRIHEMDPHTMFQSYVTDVMKDRAFTPVLPKIYAEINKALVIQDKVAADEFANIVSTAMGLRKKTDLARNFADQLLQTNDVAVRTMMKAGGVEESAFDDVLRAMKQMTYESLVLTPRATILQSLQPDFVGTAEIGLRNVQAGKMALLKKESREFAKQFDHELLGAEPGVLEELGVGGYTTAAGKIAGKIIGFPTKIVGIKKAYSALEVQNRRATFLGAYGQFKEAAGSPAGLDSVLDGLLEGEKTRVLRVLKESGPEAAAQTYGVVRSYRTNFIFSVINKPELLREGLGQLVPFTTWSTNQLARAVTDVTRVGSGNAAQLAKRIAFPIVAVGAFRAVTGLDIPNSHPVGDITGAARLQVFPALAQPLQIAAQTGSAAQGAAAVSGFIPGVAQYQGYKKRLAQTGSRTAALFGLKPVFGSALERSLPEFLRKNVK